MDDGNSPAGRASSTKRNETAGRRRQKAAAAKPTDAKQPNVTSLPTETSGSPQPNKTARSGTQAAKRASQPPGPPTPQSADRRGKRQSSAPPTGQPAAAANPGASNHSVPRTPDKRLPARLPGCLELQIHGNKSLKEVSHAVGFISELQKLPHPEWCLVLLTQTAGKQRLEEILCSQKFVWTAAPQLALANVCPFPTVISPIMETWLNLFDKVPHLPRRLQCLLDAICVDDDVFDKIHSLFCQGDGVRAKSSHESTTVLLHFTCHQLCVLGNFMAKRMERMRVDDISTSFAGILHELNKRLPAFSRHELFGKAKRIMNRCHNVLDFPVPANVTQAVAQAGVPNPSCARSNHFLRRRQARFEYDAPGDLSKDGPRHDNDFPDILRVSVVPTPNELVAKRLPALPRNGPDEEHHLPPESIERMLDVHFRQLRHEAIFPLVTAARRLVEKVAEVKQCLLRRGSSRIDMERQLGCSHDENVPLFAFSNSIYCGVDIDNTVGVVHRFQADEIRELYNKSIGARKNAWKKGEIKLLAVTDTVLILRTDGDYPPGVVPITAALVASEVKPVTVDVPSRIEITVRLMDRRPAATEMFADVNAKYVIFDVRAGFFSFEPILESLKEIDTLNMSPVLADLGLTRQELVPVMPQYIRARETLDFSCLLKPNSDEADVDWAKSIRVDALRTGTQDELLQRLDRISKLDPGQARALIETLQRSIAITQGPPGTGKTFLGVAIVDLLLRNRLVGSGVGPLLIICYTNHALDQFLEHILQIQPRVRMIRMGGGTKSETLQPYVLREAWYNLGKRRSEYGQEFRGAFRDNKEICEENEAECTRLRNEMTQANPSWETLRDLIQIEMPEMFHYFSEAEQALDEFFKSGQEIAGLPKDVLQVWLCPLRRVQPSLPTPLHKSEEPSIKEKNMFSALAHLGDEDDSASESEEKGDDQQTPPSLSAKSAAQSDGPNETDAELEAISEEIQRIIFAPSSPTYVRHEDVEFENVRMLDPWALSVKVRRSIFQKLVAMHRKACHHKFVGIVEKMEKSYLDLKEIKDAEKANFLKVQDIIGATMTGLGKYRKMIQAAGSRVLILEEAAEILEAHTISAMSANIQHVILIGDHKQLRPKVNVYDLQCDSQLGFDMDRSLFERLVEDRSAPTGVLSTQYRMRPEISEIVRRTIYPYLIDADATTKHPPVRGMKDFLYFWDHRVPEDHLNASSEKMFICAGTDKSKSNTYEIECVLAIATYLLQQGYRPQQITILTGYIGQSTKMAKYFRDHGCSIVMSERDIEDLQKQSADLLQASDSDPGISDESVETRVLELDSSAIRIATIDNFQGEENDIIIISLVRSNPSNISGFIKIANRINVLLSRAKHGMYLIGNSATLTAQAGLWRDVVDHLHEHGRFGADLNIYCQNHPDTCRACRTPKDFQAFATDGGCTLACGSRMTCGHVCPKRCHPGGHEGLRCSQPCRRTPPGCAFQHQCTRLCFQDCGQCNVEVDGIALPCGHTNSLPCWEASNPQDESCRFLVKVVLPCCYHEIEVKCWEKEGYEKGLRVCTSCCNRPLKCKHKCTGKCGNCVKISAEALRVPIPTLTEFQVQYHEKECQVKCERPLINMCGHRCGQQCHTFFGTQCGQQQCAKQCTFRCEHSSCKLKCGEPCIPCVELCNWKCDHQGRCNLVCSAPCVRLPCNLRCQTILPCKHRCPGICGEDCRMYQAFCVDCNPNENILNMVVDLIDLRTLREINLDETPLIAFPCGKHVLTVDSADGIMDIDQSYERDKATGKFVGTKPIIISTESLVNKQCPSGCGIFSHDSSSIKRYGRVMNQRMAAFSQQKLMHKVEQVKSKFENALNHCSQPSASQTEKLQLAKDLYNIILILDQFRLNVAHNMERGMFQYFEKAYSEPLPLQWAVVLRLALRLLNLPESQSCADHIYDFKFDSKRRFGFLIIKQTIHILWQLIERDAISSFWSLVIAAAPTMIKFADKKLNKCRVDAELERILMKVLAMLEVSLETLMNSDSMVGMPRTVISSCTSLLTAITSSNLDLTATSNTASFTCRFAECALILMMKTANKLCSAPVLDISTWIDVCQFSSCGLQFFRSSTRLIAMLHDSTVPNKVRQCFRNQAEKILNSGYLSLKDRPVVEDLATKLKSDSPLTKEELDQIIKAIGFAPEAHGYNGSGHWNICPKGHPYVIGECGGAMEEATCAECGARIGGERHQLRNDNRRIRTSQDLLDLQHQQ